MACSVAFNSIIENNLTGSCPKYHWKYLLFDGESSRVKAVFAKCFAISNIANPNCNEILERYCTKSSQGYLHKPLQFGVGSPSRKSTRLTKPWLIVNADGNEMIMHDIAGFFKKYNQKFLSVSLASCDRNEGSARCCSFSNVNANVSDFLSSHKEKVSADGVVPKTSQQVPTSAEASGDGFFVSEALKVDSGGVGGGSGNHAGYGGNDDNGSGNGDDEDADGEGYGPIMNSEEVSREAKARGITLPPDLVESARTVGIEKLLLLRYFQLQGALWPLGSAIRNSPMLRNWMLADPSFLFKLLVEVAIDATCATIAEVQKRGKDFWSEFELYASDLVVGVVLDITLVCMLAPYVQFGGRTPPQGAMRQLSKNLGALPSSMFEAERPGRHFTLYQRVGTLFVKGVQYGIVGFICGLIGQGFASTIMTFKRKLQKSDKQEVAIPPILPSAALWGVFMAVSSNTRYQIVNGLERVVESSLLAKQIPQFAMAFTVGIRFANNIYGGMQFVDWARWAGVQ